MPEAPGRRLRVLAVGLRQLGAECETICGELSAAAARSFVAASPWQSTVGSVTLAAAAASKDLAAIARRVGARGADYSMAGIAYTGTEDHSAARLRGLVS
ncbi:hypothetical protein JMUB5695_02234 [Mycobacterium heckeshornense]|uniref:hypothetical protein n=1 Tax=Mycobacterium heckeshornense TaxID=110505 RepID=UPI0019425F0E|nr:hypothetical protein [Mycobacterium heckeshornense]BCQ08795.1 hypothetical protein JMUB5695_02234 [Mycobacterium heckeshornense]